MAVLKVAISESVIPGPPRGKGQQASQPIPLRSFPRSVLRSLESVIRWGGGMEFHKPKPWHGAPDLLKEVGIIVIAVVAPGPLARATAARVAQLCGSMPPL